LLPILPYNRSGRFEADAYGSTLIDECALSGNPPNDIFRG
jgi:hypothetical protein